ncbi:hypothetical protein GCM10011364_17980 [Mangrovimonas yunxiaonensis]|nr:hypothetical protein GCM10011364_17980 [Mangrovimonas yunxiaonensis]
MAQPYHGLRFKVLYPFIIKNVTKMKSKYIFLFIMSALFAACSSDNNDDDYTPTPNDVENLTLVSEISNDNHTIEIYTKTGMLYTGHNNISLRVKNNATNAYFSHVTFDSWMPVMQMTEMSHACPKTDISKIENTNALYGMQAVFQMTNPDASGWSFTFNYTINNEAYTAQNTVEIWQNDHQNVTTFMGSDGSKYILALIQPENPKIGINNMVVGLYTMESMMSFPKVANYSLTLDPRMPGMGNHSSPNNTALTYNTSTTLYNGDLSLTMTGYWKLNLKLLDSEGTILKGEDVTDTNEASSLYLEIEF